MKNNVFIYLPSCQSKTVCIFFFCEKEDISKKHLETNDIGAPWLPLYGQQKLYGEQMTES